MIDYKALLKKYMSIVYGNGCYCYLGSADIRDARIDLTEEQLAELKSIEREVEND